MPPPDNAVDRGWSLRFLRNALLWLAPVWLVWTLLTPSYNRFLLGATENLLHLFESPNVTDLERHPSSRHEAYIARRDFPPKRSLVRQLRVTDLHFHFVLLGALFLAVPGIPARRRLENFGLACLATIFFDLLLFAVWVKSVYATQLGDWSLAHYGPAARNLYGLGKHLLDLPFKLALPLLLWAGFYLELLLREPPPLLSPSSGEGRKVKTRRHHR